MSTGWPTTHQHCFTKESGSNEPFSLSHPQSHTGFVIFQIKIKHNPSLSEFNIHRVQNYPDSV